MKQREIPPTAIIINKAEDMLTCLRIVNNDIAELEAKANAEMAAIKARYESTLTALRDGKGTLEKSLINLMKKNKGIIFDGTDVMHLKPGSLIHNIAEKVSIPKGALDECKAQGFMEVIKVMESLDRDAIEKWPDAKLVLIGAERKQKEEFSYDLKTGMPQG